MKLEFYPSEKLKREILEIISKYLDLNTYKVFFFGSRVRGDNFAGADIDIGIEGPYEIPSKIKLLIEEEIDELPTLYKFDIVDFKKVTDEFKREASKYLEYVK